jgi:hypothetical protein
MTGSNNSNRESALLETTRTPDGGDRCQIQANESDIRRGIPFDLRADGREFAQDEICTLVH